MALTTESANKPEPKKATTAQPESDTKPTGNLAPAAESSDPEVHRLLAEKQTAQLNGDEDQIKDIDRQLGELGYR